VTVIPKVSAIIPCFNDWEHTRLSLSALKKSNYKDLSIIVVDDGSSDSTSANIAREFIDVQVIRGDGNLWWSGSMNFGIQKAMKNNTDYIFVLNNDVLVSPDTISELVLCAQNNSGAIIGSLVYDAKEPQVIWSAGGDLKWPWPGEVQKGVGEFDRGQYDGTRQVEWTPGMGTLIHRDILLKLRNYDAYNMPQYIADVDFCLRAGKLGYKTLITSKSKIYNHLDNTGGIKKSGRMTWGQFKSIFNSLRSPEYFKARSTFISRHCPWYLLVPAYAIRYARLLIYAIR
jgi:N-acetylglucosaminyl-diphospho-decaprenol L-rhamnosyltransferase